MKNPFKFVDAVLCDAMSAVMGIVYRRFDVSPRRQGRLIQSVLAFMASFLAAAILVSTITSGRASIKDALEIASMVFTPLIVAIPEWKAFMRASNKYDRLVFTDMAVDAEFNRDWDLYLFARLVTVMTVGILVWLSVSIITTSSEPGARGLMAVTGSWVPLALICFHYIRAAAPPPPYSGGTVNKGFLHMHVA